jgi:hypothetical protein
VLLAESVLREEAGPVFGVQVNLGAIIGTVKRCRPLPWHNYVDRFHAPLDDVRVLGIERDPETPYSAVPGDAAVTQVKTEQVAVIVRRQAGEVVDAMRGS